MSHTSSTDQQALFERLFDENYRRLIIHALRYVNDEDDAEDVVADVFADLWNRMDLIDLESGIVSYLYRAVSSRSLNVLRHRNVAAVRIETLEAINNRCIEFADSYSLDDDVHSREIRQGLTDAIKQLPDKCRNVFILSYVNGLKSKEIAEAMGISARTVEAHIYKALKMLREKLKYLTVFLIAILYMYTV